MGLDYAKADYIRETYSTTNITVEDLARELDVSPSTISYTLNNKRWRTDSAARNFKMLKASEISYYKAWRGVMGSHLEHFIKHIFVPGQSFEHNVSTLNEYAEKNNLNRRTVFAAKSAMQRFYKKNRNE